jgi:hypothetical protein
LRSTVAVVVLGVLLVLGPACSFGAPAPAATSAVPSPTLLPPPKPLSSPEAASPQPASPAPVALATPIPPPNSAAAAPAAPAPGGERVRVANTGGDGANMRAEPAANATLVRTIKEGTDLEVVGADRDAGGRRWRNVRDPAGGVSGWIAADFLAAIAPEAAPAAPAAQAAPPAQPSPAASGSPVGAPAPAAAAPAPAASPALITGQAPAQQRIGEADRAYLSALQPQVDAFSKAIDAANEQIERAGGRPDMVSDPAWRQDTQNVARSFADVATKIRAATPGPNTGEVRKYAVAAADRADAASAALSSVLQSGDARGLNSVRTELVRLLAEINNMNLSLLNLQS